MFARLCANVRTLRSLWPVVLASSVPGACNAELVEPPDRVLIRTDAVAEAETSDTPKQSVAVGVRSLHGNVAQVGLGISLLATVHAPKYQGVELQATDAQWVGDFVFASYNVRGPTFLGAIQVIDATVRNHPKVLAEAIYPNTDLSRIRVSGGRILAAGADPVWGSTLEAFTLDGVTLSYDGFLALGSFAATFIELDGDRAYVSYGAGGGVAVIDVSTQSLTLERTYEVADARWVNPLPGDGFIAVAGSPGRLLRWDDPSLGTWSATCHVDGAAIGAPTWASRFGGRLYLSSDDAGLLVYDVATLSLVGQMPTEGTANGSALTADGRLAMLANGEEGLVVADVVDPTQPVMLASIDVIDDRGSANAVALNGNDMALADGLGGVKIIRFERETTVPGDCDDDGLSDDVDTDDDDDGVLDVDDAAPCDPDVICADGMIDYTARFVGDLYNLPCDHPDVEGPITGVVKGTTPFDFDWFDDAYYAFSVQRDSLIIDYGEDYFPVDEGLCGDPHYFAAHWRTTAVATHAGVYRVEMGSDDDSWLIVDGQIVIDLGGIHAIKRESADLLLEAGPHAIEIYFAERHVVQSGLEFEVVGLPDPTAELRFVQHECLDPEGDVDGDGITNASDVAPLNP